MTSSEPCPQLLTRWLQKLVVSFLLFLQPLSLIIAVALTLYRWTCPCMLAYWLWIYIGDSAPSTGSRSWRALRRLSLWRVAAAYFPITLVKTADLDPERHYLFGYHPHGILSIGAFLTFAADGTGFAEAFPGVDPYLLTLAPITRGPFGRELLLGLGLGTVARKTCEYHLRHPAPGRSVAIVVGGAQESLAAEPSTLTLTLANRKGFVRVALQTGASLVPVLSFGENDLFCQWHHPKIRQLQETFQRWLGWTVPLFFGRGIFQHTFGLLPWRKPVFVVVGAPIHCPPIATPTPEQVDEYHARYLEALERIFEAHKEAYMPHRTQSLVFVEARSHSPT